MEAQELIHRIAKKENVKSFLIEILEAFQNLDYHKLNDLLDNDVYYEDKTKTAFIYQQKRIFAKFQESGDTRLTLSTNICTGCLCSEPVFVFLGNNSNIKYAIYVEFTDGEITDIFRCSEQSDWLEGMLPF